MLFNGIFNDLTIPQCVALLSCFVINENVKEEIPKLALELSAPYKILQVMYEFFEV
jgi:ATP-dependent RNA helicase DOB1